MNDVYGRHVQICIYICMLSDLGQRPASLVRLVVGLEAPD